MMHLSPVQPHRQGADMSNPHTVKITGDEECPHVEFTCNAGPEADCRNYPGCDCESWDDDHHHPKVAHPTCWMKAWFDADYVSPMAGTSELEESGYTVGMEGPITTEFHHDFVGWAFKER